MLGMYRSNHGPSEQLHPSQNDCAGLLNLSEKLAAQGIRIPLIGLVIGDNCRGGAHPVCESIPREVSSHPSPELYAWRLIDQRSEKLQISTTIDHARDPECIRQGIEVLRVCILVFILTAH